MWTPVYNFLSLSNCVFGSQFFKRFTFFLQYSIYSKSYSLIFKVNFREKKRIVLSIQAAINLYIKRTLNPFVSGQNFVFRFTLLRSQSLDIYLEIFIIWSLTNVLMITKNYYHNFIFLYFSFCLSTAILSSSKYESTFILIVSSSSF